MGATDRRALALAGLVEEVMCSWRLFMVMCFEGKKEYEEERPYIVLSQKAVGRHDMKWACQ